MAAGQLAGDDIFHGMRGNEYDIRKAREREGRYFAFGERSKRGRAANE